MTNPDTCSVHGYHGGWFDCPRCEGERRHKESMEALERDHESRATEREDVRRRHEDLKEELRLQREAAETRADDERERSREREQNVRLASTGKLKVQEDVRMAIRCLRQGDAHRAKRLVESALDAWPTYGWGWLASAELSVACGRDPSLELIRAGQNVIEDESDALFTLSLEAEFSAKLKLFAFDPAQEKLVRDNAARYAFIAGLFSLDGGKTARQLNWVAPYPDIIGQFLLLVDQEALLAYERHLCGEIEGASGPAIVLSMTTNVELVLRLSGRHEGHGPRRSAFYVLSAWCEQVLVKEGAETVREFTRALSAMERTVASLPWSEPKEALDRAKAIFDQRARERAARETASHLEQKRQQKLEAERRTAAAAADDKKQVVLTLSVVGGLVAASLTYFALIGRL